MSLLRLECPRMSPSEFVDLAAKWLDIIGRFAAALGVIGLAIAYIFKRWIGEWIKSRFSRAVEKELAVHKHQLERELEAYKGSVLQELEQFRANVDIRRTIALKRADTKLDLVRKLDNDFDTYHRRCLVYCVADAANAALRMKALGEALESWNALEQSVTAAGVFLPLPLMSRITAANVKVASLRDKCKRDNVHLNRDDVEINALTLESAQVRTALRQEIHAMPEGLGKV
jgi:hypothetical protein